jgi:predicted RNA-binding Zn-ribbon protein involved in translation (DUF1610 family)
MDTEEDIVTFDTYYDPMLAQIIRTRLEDNGIPCFVVDENLGTLYPAYNATAGGIKVKIFARDMEKSKAIIAEDDTTNVESLTEDEIENSVFCPHCGSNKVQYGLAEKPNKGWFGKLFSAVGLSEINAKHQFHCFNCGKNFE